MAAARPTAWAAHSILKLFLSAANPAGASLVLLRVLYPADKLVARQRGDVLPAVKRDLVGQKRCAQIGWKFVDDAARYALAHLPKDLLRCVSCRTGRGQRA